MDRDDAMRHFIDGEHCRYRRRDDVPQRPGEVALNEGFRLHLEAPPTPLTARMLADFERFCRQCLEVRPGNQDHGVTWRLTASDAPLRRDDPATEAFVIAVSDEGIVIDATHERGLLHATHWLERELADRGAPYLAAGRIARAPAFMPRLSNSIFIDADQDIADGSPFSDDYLGLMSHFGVNGIHLHCNLHQFWRSERLPELNATDYADRLAGLRTLNRRALAHGIDLYLYLACPPLPADHPLFMADPSRRGSLTDFTTVRQGEQLHSLCLGNDAVLDGCAEAVGNLFREAPELGGALIIVGGEGFVHCYTRPAKPHDGYSACPCCRDAAPSLPVARLVNRLAAAVHGTGEGKLVFAWPYSAFTWSGDDRAQEAWIGHLDAGVSLLANLATGSVDESTGGGVILYDYNIKSPGPTAVFRRQAKRCHQAGRPVFAKIESNTTPMAFFLPYLPVFHRWHRRYREMTATGVRGFVGQWRFYGMNGSPPEEIQYHATWNPEREADEVLATIARRDLGAEPAAAASMVEGWRELSLAWDDFPYSALTCGERAFYMRGPFYLGPAHPLIFDPQKSYDLPPAFRQISACLFELGIPENLDEIIRQAPPRYVADLLLTVPFGVDRYLELAERCRHRWERGLSLLRAALPAPNLRARMELNVVETIAIHLGTLVNTVRFLAARDRLWRGPLDRDGFVAQIGVTRGIVQDEIANAERSLPILDRDPRIGYGHCYGMVYDRAMVDAKLRQCRSLLTEELPSFAGSIRFHLWNDF